MSSNEIFYIKNKTISLFMLIPLSFNKLNIRGQVKFISFRVRPLKDIILFIPEQNSQYHPFIINIKCFLSHFEFKLDWLFF